MLPEKINPLTAVPRPTKRTIQQEKSSKNIEEPVVRNIRTSVKVENINDQVNKRIKATWTDETTRIFCEVCAEEVNAGNRPHTHFNKIGWVNVASKFNHRSGLNYDQKQLKNKWEKVKNEYITWKNLIEKETGLGWNNELNTIDAPKEWWTKQILVNPTIGKFRYGGLQNQTELEIMFNKIVASSSSAWNPYFEDEHVVEATQHSDENDINLGTPTIETETEECNEDNVRTKRNAKNVEKPTKSKVSTSNIMQHQMQRMVDAVEGFSATTATSRRVDLPGCSVEECLDLLAETPGVELGSELYMLGTRLLVKRDNREMFAKLPNDDIRSAWLEQELEILKSNRKH